jgi:uncharacterized oxidoreductase
MKLENKTILITGGSSGIGRELAMTLARQGNTILICGRSAEKLSEVRSKQPSIHTLACDLSISDDRSRLFHWVSTNHPACSMLINNAALVHKTDFRTDPDMSSKTDLEIQTNLVAPITLIKLFLPLLERNRGAIINITTGLIYAPRAVYPIYNATKAGLHSFTKVLRHQLTGIPVKVVEVMMPVVDTPWHKGNVPRMAIPVQQAVNEMLVKLERDEVEIHVGKVWLLYFLSRLAPAFAFQKINTVK